MEQKNDLDPRIQIELENLNTATEEINKLEIELEEANSTFHILLNESTRRLKLLTKKLGSCIEKSRPYYEALEKARLAQIECQQAAAKFQRANEIHAAAKETVALAEERFMSNSHNWPFDNAWQEMLNHATIKVMDAEKKKAESHAEHQIKAHIFSMTEQKTQQIEERQRRNIQKSRPYFEEKQLCQEQLQTQKDRIQELEIQIKSTKASYATSLKNLEKISEEIHKTRGDLPITPPGPREPGVGAELCSDDEEHESEGKMTRSPQYATGSYFHNKHQAKNFSALPINELITQYENDFSLDTASLDTNSMMSEDKDDDDYKERIDVLSNAPSNSTTAIRTNSNANVTNTTTATTASPVATTDSTTNSQTEVISNKCDNHELDLEELRQKVKVLAVRPVEGGDGQTNKDCWESELNETVNKLDRLMMLQENSSKAHNSNNNSYGPISNTFSNTNSSIHTTTPTKNFNNCHNAPIASSGGVSVATAAAVAAAAASAAASTLPPATTNVSAASNSSTATSTTKAFLNNSLQAVQQKMEELLPNAQTPANVMQNMKELPLLSRISNEISANTANTVKVLKRRLSLN